MQYLKTQSLVGTYRHVLEDDPAFDRGADAKARKAFAEAYGRAFDTGDFSAVPTHPGMTPVTWELRHLSEVEWRLVQDVNGRYGLNSGFLEAVALALVGVEGLPDLEVTREMDRARRGFQVVTPDVLGRLTPDVVNALGIRVFADHNPRKG